MFIVKLLQIIFFLEKSHVTEVYSSQDSWNEHDGFTLYGREHCGNIFISSHFYY